MATNSNDLTLRVGFDVNKFATELGKTNSILDSWASKITGSLTNLGGAFAGVKVAQFALDVSLLAGEAQGVKEAFDRLPNSVTVMTELKNATHGTVSELDLMKRAVMASNFDISLKALPQLLEFATLRAKQTGQSIDYLVDSIVTGIGRKSKLILDNLGISAVQLTEALGGASTASSTIGEVADAVGKIAAKNLETMGKLSENASTKMERLSASWTNLKVSMGDAANGTGILGAAMDSLTTSMDLFASKNISFLEALAAMMNPGSKAAAMIKDMAENARKLYEDQKLAESITRQATQAIATFGDNIEAMKKAYAQNINYQKIMNEVTRIMLEQEKKKEALIRNEKNLTEQLNELRGRAEAAIGKERAELNLQIQAIEKEIEVLRKLGLEKEKQAAKLNFNGLRGQELPGDPKKSNIEGVRKDIKKLMNEIEAANEIFDETFKLTEEGRKTFENFGIFTEKGLAKAAEAFKKFQKDGDLDGFKASLDKVKSSETDMLHITSNLADAFGEAFGDVISGAQSLAQAFSKMAVDIINNIERIVLANMIANASKYGVAGILMAAAGFGVVKSLFNRIGNTASRTQPVSVTPNYNGGLSNNIMQRGRLEAVVTGKQLKFILKEQDTFDSQVKTVR